MKLRLRPLTPHREVIASFLALFAAEEVASLVSSPVVGAVLLVPVLLYVPGYLLLRACVARGELVTDRRWQVPASVVLSLALLVVEGVVPRVLGVDFDRSTVVAVQVAWAAVFAAVALFHAHEPAAASVVSRFRPRDVAMVGVGTIAFVAAVGVALAMQPDPVVRFDQLSLTGPAAAHDGPLVAGTDGNVTVDFALHRHDTPVGSAAPTVMLDGRKVADGVAVTDTADGLHGSARIPIPDDGVLHRIRIIDPRPTSVGRNELIVYAGRAGT